MLVYSIATALCGFTQTAGQLMICRMVLGLGMGGEWASGAALVAETWPAQHRGKALALVQSSWAVGYALGAAVVALVMPRFGWRAVFFAGIVPALITLWLRRSLREPEVWQEQRRSQRRPGPALSRGVRPQHADLRDDECGDAFRMVGTLHVGATLSFHVDGEGGRGLSIVQTSAWTIVMQVGTFLGYIVFGYLADRFSRKYTYIGYLLIAALLVPLFAFVRNPNALLLMARWSAFLGPATSAASA